MHFTGRSFILAMLLAGLSACATAPEPLPEPVLDYAISDCASDIDLAQAVTMSDDPKKIKRMMKNRTIVLSHVIGEDTLCLRQPSGRSSPYAVFKLPSDIKGPVVYAGSTIDSNSMFAADIIVLDEAGAFRRNFKLDAFRKLGTRYGVQFRPRDDEAYVLIKANEALIGEQEETTETIVGTVYRAGTNGNGGNDIVANTHAFTRTFSYDGEVGIRVVFPKQEETK